MFLSSIAGYCLFCMQGLKMIKGLLNIFLVLFLILSQTAYAGSCFKDKDADDCRVKLEQGIPDSQYNLGKMYYKGLGVPQDYKEAAKWTRLAAEQGIPLAQFNLGFMYDHGQGVLQDY